MFTYYRKVRKYGTNWWQDVPINIVMCMLISFHIYILRVRPLHHNEDPKYCNYQQTQPERKKEWKEGKKIFKKEQEKNWMGVGKVRMGGIKALRKRIAYAKVLRQKWGSYIWDEKRRLVWLELQNKGEGWASGDRQGPNYGAFGRTCSKDFGFYSGYNGKLWRVFRWLQWRIDGMREEWKWRDLVEHIVVVRAGDKHDFYWREFFHVCR